MQIIFTVSLLPVKLPHLFSLHVICFLSKITIECVCSLFSKHNPHELFNSYYANQFTYPEDTCAQFHSQGPAVCFRNLKTKVHTASFFATLQISSAWSIKDQTSLSFTFFSALLPTAVSHNQGANDVDTLSLCPRRLKRKKKNILRQSKSKNSFPKVQTLKNQDEPNVHSTGSLPFPRGDTLDISEINSCNICSKSQTKICYRQRHRLINKLN